ncbi:isoleucine--tRNA ligase [soil metagenome]
MAFEKVETQQVDFPAFERNVLAFWEQHRIFDKLKAKNAGKPKWSFLDGPITANNPMGVHHAWGRTYKDAFNRYFAMTGRELRYQQGFDCQGLWVEVEVEKSLGLKSKRDIENLVPGDPVASIDTFVNACKDRVNKFARVQTQQSIRLGMWMNWDTTDVDWAKSPDERQSYFTMSEANNFTIWKFLKQCCDKKMVYRGYDVMPWCGRCGVGISEQEMKEGYKLVEHRACFVKLPLKDKPGENLLVWTTTPWTLTSNVGAAVNPKLSYLKVKLKGEIYYIGKAAFKLNRMESAGDPDEPEATAKKSKRDWLDGVPHLSSIEQHFKSKAGKEPVEIVGEVKGEAMLGWEYIGPFDDLPAQQHAFGFPEEVAKITQQQGWCPPKSAAESHRVVSGGVDVTESEGTGIVHSAPGCGSIDYTWGKQHGLPPVAPIDDSGTIVDGFGTLTGKNAAEAATADAVFELLKAKDRLLAVERYVHRYPHCWRCKTELLYRLVDEWFIGMGPKLTIDGFRGEVMEVVDKVTFLPESLNGRAREKDWLKNMGDWMISKKRYWGLALPIWVDEKDPTQFEVIGSREELKERAIEGWSEFDGHTPHRPWIDKIVITNPKTGNRMHRVPDVGNPWLDAGVVAFSTMPADWRPADFITESFPGQFRNWFYALLTMSTMLGDGAAPFKTLLGFATVKDQYGEEMHKSTGNSIEFTAAADTGGEIKDPKGNVIPFKAIGADVMRWLYCRHNPAMNLNFGPAPTDEVRAKFILKLWNVYGFFVNYAMADGYDATLPPVPFADRPAIDRWVLSDLQSLIAEARESFEAYDTMSFCLATEAFVDDKLSNWYVRRNRPRFHSKTAELDDAGRQDKLSAYQTLHEVLRVVTQLIAPCVPFLAETMWKNLGAGDESVHLSDYPTVNDEMVDADLSNDMDAVIRIVSLGGAARNLAKQKTRQPLAELVVHGTDIDERAVEHYTDLILDELNVKAVRFSDDNILSATAKLNKKTAAAKLGPNLKAAEEFLKSADALELANDLKAGPVEIVGIPLEAADIGIDYTAAAGFHGINDKLTQVAIDGRVTDELKLEGLARDVIRLVQNARKDAGLELLDKIGLYLRSEGDVQKAIDAHQTAINVATQATVNYTTPFDGGFTADATVEKIKVVIQLQKVSK